MQSIFRLVIFLTFLSSLYTGASNAAEYHIGVRAHNGLDKAITRWQPTIDYLNLKIKDHHFKLAPIVELTKLDDAVRTGRLDFILTNPSSYVDMELRHGASRMLTLMNNRQGKALNQFGSVIFTLSNRNDIQTIDDLKGKHVIAVSEQAFGGWTVALRELLLHDINPDTDFAKMSFSNAIQTDVVLKVLNGEADVGIVRTDQLERMAGRKRIRLDDFKVITAKKVQHFPFLNSTRLYPEWPFARNKYTPDDVAQKVAIALLELKPDNAAAKSGNYIGWTVPLDYQPVHDLMKELRVGAYQNYGHVTLEDTIRRWWKWELAILILLLSAFGLSIHVNRLNQQLTRTRDAQLKAQEMLARRVSKQNDALETNETRQRTILDTITDGIITINTKGLIELSNPAANSIFDYPATELINCNIAILLPQHRDTFSDIDIWKSNPDLLTQINCRTDLFGSKKNGDIFPIEIHISPMNTPGGLFYTVVFRDITDRKRMDKLKNEFISTVSHELRTPLTSIRGSLGLLTSSMIDAIPQQARELLIIANNNTERLLLLINDILDVQKIEAGEMVFRYEKIRLSSFIERALLENIGYGIQYKVEFKLVQDDTGVEVYADSSRLMQVMNNLLSNAAKFSPENEVVEVNIVHHGNAVRVSITDRGPGIADNFMARLFDKFTQSDASDTRQVGGTGLGLSIAKAIIEKHGGKIGVLSKAGFGTTFFYDLPAIKNSDQASPIKPPALSVISNTHILIVEDDTDIATLLQLILAKNGHESDVAYSTQQAWEKLHDQPGKYSAITLDLMLPEDDGISFINKLKTSSKTSGIPILVISAKADQTRKELNGNAVEIVEWLQKPIDQERLLNAINQIAHHNHNPRVLHIEDEEDVHKVVKIILQDQCNLSWANSFQSAKQLLENELFDLILLDIKLPDGSGLDLIETIKASITAPKIVIFSAYDIAEKYIDKVNAVLVKSQTSQSELSAQISELLLNTSGTK